MAANKPNLLASVIEDHEKDAAADATTQAAAGQTDDYHERSARAAADQLPDPHRAAEQARIRQFLSSGKVQHNITTYKALRDQLSALMVEQGFEATDHTKFFHHICREYLGLYVPEDDQLDRRRIRY